MTAAEEVLRRRRAAAEAAAALVESGMAVGLGSGATASLAVEALGRRVRAGLDIVGIPTSARTEAVARSSGVRLIGFDERRRLDIAIDGADEVARDGLGLVKGGGGALLREKIVACASDRVIIVVDTDKVVARLGERVRLPVEVVPFGWQATLDRLASLGVRPALRGGEEAPFVTDGGHYIADCAVGPIADPTALEARLNAVPGVVETGLFLGIADQVFVGGAGGVEVWDRGG